MQFLPKRENMSGTFVKTRHNLSSSYQSVRMCVFRQVLPIQMVQEVAGYDEVQTQT